jgi:magnesium-transporting ATPase (P-type)
MEEKTVSPSVGLREDEVLRARREHGENILSRQKRKSFLRQFLGNLNDPVIRILLAALGVHLLLLFGNGDLAETVGIGIAVFLATFISTLSEYGSARAFERLEEDEGGIFCRVRRGGKVKEIPIREVTVNNKSRIFAQARRSWSNIFDKNNKKTLTMYVGVFFRFTTKSPSRVESLCSGIVLLQVWALPL